VAVVRGSPASGHLKSSAAMAPKHGTEDEEAHDVLAAEAFAVPAPDPDLRHGPVVLPEDPSGIAEPHDILAAEEFAMPAGGPPAGARSPGRGATGPRRRALIAVAALLVTLTVRRLLRR
jgi:hypothetical protein